MQKKAIIVVGLGFGDEGKGLATDYLCSQSAKPLVIRFNGGHQAGHTVVTASGHQHIFSTFGAGTLRGIPTYWSNYCTFSPAILLPEYRSLPIQPILLVDRHCPVTTHYDVLYNRALEATRGDARHGSCGLGFGATLERHQFPELQLCAPDLLNSALYQAKLQLIRTYYQTKITDNTRFSFDLFDHDSADQQFGREAEEIGNLHQQGIIQLVQESEVFATDTPWETFIFEGAQGVLLDMDFGIHPHVTRSNTTSKNALRLLSRHLPDVAATAEIFYVTRSYQTRHGAGPLPHIEENLELVRYEQETNLYNDHQGAFRISCLNVDSLNHALDCDANFSKGLEKHILITCLDQVQAKQKQLPYYYKGTVSKTNYTALPNLLDCKFKSHLFSFSSCADDMAN
jgi:adenylosuccinate synthase